MTVREVFFSYKVNGVFIPISPLCPVLVPVKIGPVCSEWLQKYFWTVAVFHKNEYRPCKRNLFFVVASPKRSDLAEAFKIRAGDRIRIGAGAGPGRKRARSADDMGAEARRSTGMRDKVSRYRSDRRICRAACAPRSVASIVSDVSERSSGARKYSEWRPRRQCRE